MAASGSPTFVLSTGALKIDTAEQLEPHIGPLRASSASTTVTRVDFSGNTLGVPACQALAQVLQGLNALEDANFADIFTGRLLAEIPTALDAILESLLVLPKLRTINLSDNAFGLNTQAPLVKYLERATSLRHLILNNNGLGPEAGANIANALTKLAKAKLSSVTVADQSPLETIVCGRNRLENGSMTAWATAVAAHGAGLKEVRMVQNGIRQEGIQILLRSGFRNCPELRLLDLQDNTFTRSGARAMADVVGSWSRLTELGVGDCLVGARGMVAIGDALGKGLNKAIEVLRLQYNEINIKGIQTIVENCGNGTLPSLRRVEVNGNKFSEDDAAVEQLKELLDSRKAQSSRTDVDDDDAWGLDELDELEDASDDEDEADDDDDEDENKEGDAAKERDLKQTDEAEAANVAPEKDLDVDALAAKLERTL